MRGKQKEIAEVRGAIRAYEELSNYQAHNIKDLLMAHQYMMCEILPDAGQFHRGTVSVHKGNKLIHIAPQANRVNLFITQLLYWIEQAEHHPLIRSCVFHYEFEFIHPFSDGNDRMGRLWKP